MTNVIGIDVGGTKIAAARFNLETWKNEKQIRKDTDSSLGFNHVFGYIVDAINELKDEDTKAIGIGVPGLVNKVDGVILNMPNIPEGKNIDLKKLLSNKINLPIFVDNDANCFVLAESMYGAGKGHSVAVGITMGTGVGGGIVIDGKVFHGATGFAGEFGHMLLKPGNPPFETDDKRGDVEQFLSGSAMGRRCKEADSPDEYLSGDTCEFMHPDIRKEIAWLVTNLIHTLNPSVLIFGGSAGRALAPHLKEMKEVLKLWTLPGTPLPELKIAILKDSAIQGAALITI